MPEIGTLDIKVNTQEVRTGASELDKLTDSGRKAEQQTRQVDTATDRLQRSMLTLRGAVAGVAAAFASYKLTSIVKDSAMMAARYETLGITMTQAGHNAGYTKQQMDDLEVSLRKQGIAGIEAREVLTRLAASNMDLSQASDMARAAQNLAVVANINSSEAFERLVRGIQSGETEILRSMGLNVNFDLSYQKLARSIGVTTQALTQQEKVQARTSAVMEATSGYVGLYEQAMGTAGKQITSFTRYWKDAQVELGNSELPALTGMVEKATESIKEFQAWVKKPDVQDSFAVIGQSASTAFDAVVKFGGYGLKLFTDILNGWNSLPQPIKEWGIIGALAGGKKGLLIAAGVSLVSDYADGIGKMGKAIDLVRSGQASYADIPLWDKDKFEEWLRQRDSIIGLQQRLQQVRQELASGAGVSEYAGKNDEHRLQLLRTEQELLGKINAEKARSKVAQSVALPDGALKKPAPDQRLPQKPKGQNKIFTATESITAELAKANDTSEDGVGKVAELQKKYDEFAKVLGHTNPLVQQYGTLIAYASAHNGNVPSEVAKATREVEKQTRGYEAEIAALQAVSGLYGQNYTDALTMYQAETAAQETYTEAIKKGVSAQTAAAEMAAKLASVQAQADASKQQAGKSLAASFGGPAYDASVEETKAQYDAAKAYTTDRVGLERAMNSKLAQMESARLKATGESWNGAKSAMLDYSESVGTAADRMASLWNSGFKSMEDALSNFVGNGELDITSLFKTIRTEIARTMVVQPFLQTLSSGISSGSLWSSITGLFSAKGNAFGPSGLLAFADGGVVASPTPFRFSSGGANLGIMGEAGPEAILPLKRGSDGKLGVSSGASSAPQNITVKMVNNSGQQLKISSSKATSNGLETQLLVAIDAIQRNVGGSRDKMQAALGVA